MVLTRREALAWGLARDEVTHIAIQEKQNSKVVDWMEKVTDDQYRK